FAQAHPAGSPVTIFYDPQEPDRAVLLPGLGGEELFSALVILPFNVVMLGMWGLALGFLARGGRTPYRLLYGLRISESEAEVRVRLPSLSPGAAGLLTLLAGPIVLVFVVVLCAGLPPPLGMMIVCWAILLGSAALIYRTVAARIASGKADL